MSMFEKLNYITLSGVEYPIKCDLVVIEKIQDKYGNLSDYENKLNGFYPAVDENGEYKRNEEGKILGLYGEPSISILKEALNWMVEEGMEIAREEGKDTPSIDGVNLIRKADLAPRELSEILHDEFARCFERKNPKTTQGKTTETMKDSDE